MNKNKKKNLDKIESVFQIDAFQSEDVYAVETLAVSAVVMDDNEHVVLDLSPELGNTVYRVPKSAVKIGPVNEEIKIIDGKSMQFRHVIINRKASIVHLTKGTAETFLDPIGRARIDRLIEVATLRAHISFQANGEGILKYAGREVNCLGEPGEKYPKDLTVQGVTGVDKFKQKFSNEYQVWMDWAILIVGQKGIYIHEGADNLQDNGGSSAGCIHLSEINAKPFYDWVTGRTRITIDYSW